MVGSSIQLGEIETLADVPVKTFGVLLVDLRSFRALLGRIRARLRAGLAPEDSSNGGCPSWSVSFFENTGQSSGAASPSRTRTRPSPRSSSGWAGLGLAGAPNCHPIYGGGSVSSAQAHTGGTSGLRGIGPSRPNVARASALAEYGSRIEQSSGMIVVSSDAVCPSRSSRR
jgi:hypothetical protein